MPILTCPICCNEFEENLQQPISLGCGHTMCKACLSTLHKRECPCDQASVSVDIDKLPVNTALPQLVGVQVTDENIPEIECIKENKYLNATRKIGELALLKSVSASSNGAAASTASSNELKQFLGPACAMQEEALLALEGGESLDIDKLPVNTALPQLVGVQVTDESIPDIECIKENKTKYLNATRKIGELALLKSVSASSNGATASTASSNELKQFLGPAMQEEALLAPEGDKSLCRKVPTFPQASKTGSTGRRVFQLNSRMPCLVVTIRDDSSLIMQLKELHVTGVPGDKQFIATMQHYVNRPIFLINVMRKQMDSSTICDMVLNAMRCNMADHKIQTAGSALLYHLSLTRDKAENQAQAQAKSLTDHQRRKIVSVTLDAMENHITEEQLQHNCCQTLCNFEIPAEVEYAYERVARALLRSAVNHKTDEIRVLAIASCKQLVFQRYDGQKVTVGRDLGGVKIALQAIRQKLDSDRPDQFNLLGYCWDALWNFTDETPENCSLFIENGGMDLFMECKEKLGQQPGILRNMLGLMGNVSEVDFLRPHFMKCAGVFYDLLDTANELEVSYNAAGILCHMAYDGPDVWTCDTVTREMAMEKLVDCIGHWDIEASRQMSYQSFAPILRLLQKYDTPAIQHWGTWALANLCNVDPVKYCALIIAENGVPLLENLLMHPDVPARVREYSQIVLNKCQPFTQSILN